MCHKFKKQKHSKPYSDTNIYFTSRSLQIYAQNKANQKQTKNLSAIYTAQDKD